MVLKDNVDNCCMWSNIHIIHSYHFNEAPRQEVVIPMSGVLRSVSSACIV